MHTGIRTFYIKAIQGKKPSGCVNAPRSQSQMVSHSVYFQLEGTLSSEEICTFMWFSALLICCGKWRSAAPEVMARSDRIPCICLRGHGLFKLKLFYACVNLDDVGLLNKCLFFLSFRFKQSFEIGDIHNHIAKCGNGQVKAKPAVSWIWEMNTILLKHLKRWP